MTRFPALVYILRHAWLWPLVFWMRPLQVIHQADLNNRERWEIGCAMLGGAFWGLVGAVILYGYSGNLQVLWVMPVAVAVAVAVAGAVAGVVAGAVIVAVAIVLGIISGLYLSAETIQFILFLCGGFIFLSFSFDIISSKRLPNWIYNTAILIFIFGFPYAGFAFLPALAIEETPIWGSTFSVALGIGFISSYFAYDDDNRTFYYAFTRKTLRKQAHPHLFFLLGLWLLGIIFALAAWLPTTTTHQLDEKLDILALFLIFMPIVFTALPLYPLIALESWRQSRYSFLQKLKKSDYLVSLRFQSFAYPLPGFFSLLRSYSQLKGTQESVLLLQKIQLQSLQANSIAQGAIKLANDPEWALPFCGTIALYTNSASTAPLALAGDAAQAVAILAYSIEKENEQPLRVRFGDYPPNFDRINLRKRFFIPQQDAVHKLKHFETTRAQSLGYRLQYALARLQNCTHYAQVDAFRALLKVLLTYIQADTVQKLSAIAPTIPASQNKRNEAWLAQGWAILSPLQAIIAEVPEYRQYTEAHSRRQFLHYLLKKLTPFTSILQNKTLDGLYWEYIRTEIATHWSHLLHQEMEQAREWLKIEVEIPTQHLRTGHESLALRVRNLSGAVARKLCLRMTPTEGLHFDSHEITVSVPLERQQETTLHITFSCPVADTYLLQGIVIAEELSGATTHVSFSERLNIGLAGRPYVLQTSAPYIVGEGLGEDRTFVERGGLRHQIKALWKQPGGTPAILLLGQRRIGKSTLLNKIQRDGLDDCKLWPITIDLQGCNTPFALLHQAVRDMADYLHVPTPTLTKADPFAAFCDFLLDHPPPTGQRFLLMLDEAERIWLRLGEDMAANLRAVMQGHQYPVLLLFCGTHALRKLGHKAESTLFNTVHPFVLSYMNKQESQQVLTQPTQGILEYDPQALQEAYRLTHGQPYLLQMLGAVVIEHFDQAVLAKQPRSDYVSLRDMQLATDALIKRENPAFENYWQDANPDTRKLYSVLAWATEQNPQLDINDLTAFLHENRLTLPHTRVSELLEDLSEQGLLHNVGPTYGFTVPLFRHWLAWRWPPEKMRMI